MQKLKALAALFTLSLAAASSVQAAGYPEKPVKIIVAYQAGQGTDIATRYFADHLTKAMGQTFFVENRGGAGGNIGTQAAARAEPDGYTLTMGTNATHVLNSFLYSSLPFDPVKDFEPIILVGSFPMVVATTPNTPFNSISDILASSKASSRSADIGMPSTTARLVYELLKDKTGAPLFGVPYKGSSMAISNLIGGEIPLSIDTVTAIRAQVAAGKIKAIAVTSSEETDLLPGVPTVASQGVDDFEVIAWNALFAPKGTPKDIITKINLELQKFLAMPETRKRLLELGYDAGGGSPDKLAQFTQAEREKWAPIIKKAGIKIQ
ncbi:Bug family tripartite tricarboxylate transporter substrate binding protein [Pollutimonas harenae]|uniref:Tripartite tricarboxylate transporter substrate binding protein n=1 Tax=Pollutimonas harenae TaxID=657015 RepID=A0A853GZP4_9BURK|nr:tripartite tricarboxylate transporter substrate-binding protein [Pollutimonas harenae]NYT84515.1 tripartite tricarboxylate transporter substrate binding protein [Pollutimonas harenae]TEA73091.1 tripartite tricarboxylate transporter substrate binding protein [Pollutimonas harenae]